MTKLSNISLYYKYITVCAFHLVRLLVDNALRFAAAFNNVKKNVLKKTYYSVNQNRNGYIEHLVFYFFSLFQKEITRKFSILLILLIFLSLNLRGNFTVSISPATQQEPRQRQERRASFDAGGLRIQPPHGHHRLCRRHLQRLARRSQAHAPLGRRSLAEGDSLAGRHL